MLTYNFINIKREIGIITIMIREQVSKEGSALGDNPLVFNYSILAWREGTSSTNKDKEVFLEPSKLEIALIND